MKNYIKVNTKEDSKVKATHLVIETYYNKGGYNCFSSVELPRGYYLRATPVERGEYFESSTAFSGYCTLILSVARKSNKREIEADTIAKTKISSMVADVLKKNNLVLDSEEELNILCN